MGKKHRRQRRDTEGDEQGVAAEAVGTSSHKPGDVDFATRRELLRKQAADKRRAKMRCHLCGQTGHVRRECPGIRDDGRGMSRFHRKSDVEHEKQKYNQEKMSNGQEGLALEYPEELKRCNCHDFCYFDVSCNIQATLDYCKGGRGQAKISQREAFQEYQRALSDADNQTNMGGMISKAQLKPGRPWICPPDDATPMPQKTWYMLGLTHDFSFHDDDMEVAVEKLTESLQEIPQKVVGFWAVLNYSPTFCDKPGYDRGAQRLRAKAICQAAGNAGVTVQLQVSPGASRLEDLSHIAGTDYAQVLLDLQTLLNEVMEEYPSLNIILANWSGLSSHMLSLLRAFPERLTIGLDASVSFAKAVHLHECAFDVPLDKLVLMTSHVIPSEIANRLGRAAFFHSGLWPFVAQAVAHYKKTISVEEVARAASTKTLQLYPICAEPSIHAQKLALRAAGVGVGLDE